MFVNVQISLSQDEAVPTATPAEILNALGGDTATDTISISVSQTSAPPPPVALEPLPAPPQ